MSKVPVLVTGGAGYIGSHAVLALKDAGWPVAVIDDLSNGTRHVVPEGVPFFEGNIADRTLVNRIFKDQQIGAIMHFAGSIVVPESVEQPLRYYANNTVASHALISAAVEAGVKHILFSSTAAVYGAPKRVPIDEEDPKAPINPYGASKLMTERIWINEPDGGAPPQLVTSAAAAAFRRDPRFLPLAQRTGLLAYWRSGRAPDFCRPPHPEPVCRQLLKRG